MNKGKKAQTGHGRMLTKALKEVPSVEPDRAGKTAIVRRGRITTVSHGLDWPTWRGEGYGRLGRRLGRGLGRVGFGLALLGIFVIVGSGPSGTVGIIGVVVLMVASLLVGVAALLTSVLPRWGAIVLIVGSLTFFLFDTETARAWCAVPYGVAWVALGYLQWAGRGVELQGPTRAR